MVSYLNEHVYLLILQVAYNTSVRDMVYGGHLQNS